MLNSKKSKLAFASLTIAALASLAGMIYKAPEYRSYKDAPVKIGVPWEGESGLHYGDVKSDALMVHKSVPSIHVMASLIDDKLIESTARWNNILDEQNNQIKVANYYSEKYSIDPKHVQNIIYLANQAGKEANINPLIIIAIIAHESNFQPTARNKSGAEGLMQVMTSIHKQKFKMFGGIHTTFDPAVNIRVGALILKQCISIKRSLKGGLRYYAGAANDAVDDGGFTHYVLSDQNMLLEMLVAKPQNITQKSHKKDKK